MIRSHKIRLDPTVKQKTYFSKACGVARFTWNWALSRYQEQYKGGKKTNALELKKEFNSMKKDHFPWVYEVTKYASQQPFIFLRSAFSAFFLKHAKYPKFKKKGVRDSFYIGGDQVKIDGKRIKIPNLGWVRMREELRFSGKIQSATITRIADFWFVSISVETKDLPFPCESQATVGVDLGVKTFATLSTGQKIAGAKSLHKYLSKLKRWQRRLSRCVKGSKNAQKLKNKLAKLHYRISCIRKDLLHKVTTYLTEMFQSIVIEDLDVSEMLSKKPLSRYISDMGFFEFKRQLCYKAELRSNTVFIADRWFPSSKTCSECGNVKKELKLSERIFNCDRCHHRDDRDYNAAKCLEKLKNTVSSTGIDACGQDGSVVMIKYEQQPAWWKQELSPV
jgi:putative transposase